jgi:hypothetical protein
MYGSLSRLTTFVAPTTSPINKDGASIAKKPPLFL